MRPLIPFERIEKAFGITDNWSAAAASFSFGVLLSHLVLVLSFVIPRWGQLEFLRLHYTAALGVDWIGPWWQISVFPAFGLLVFLVNGLLAGWLASRRPPMTAFILGSTAVLQVILVGGGFLAVLLNS